MTYCSQLELNLQLQGFFALIMQTIKDRGPVKNAKTKLKRAAKAIQGTWWVHLICEKFHSMLLSQKCMGVTKITQAEISFQFHPKKHHLL